VTASALDPGTRWFTIQEVSRHTGLSEPTLRYYEKIGLIGAVTRDDSSRHRRYDPATMDTLEALACLRSAGMRVSDMRRYLDLLELGQSAAAQQRELFSGQADRLAGEIERLQLRLAYLQRKAEMWAARDSGDTGAERRATAEIVRIMTLFSDETTQERT
jgi:DNA-binding transcriptional MerR regulator